MLTYEKRTGLGIPLAIADTSAVRQRLVWRQDEKLAETVLVFSSMEDHGMPVGLRPGAFYVSNKD